jgi:hypothetical protein
MNADLNFIDDHMNMKATMIGGYLTGDEK